MGFDPFMLIQDNKYDYNGEIEKIFFKTGEEEERDKGDHLNYNAHIS